MSLVDGPPRRRLARRRLPRAIGDGPMRALESLARRLRGHRIVMVNSTTTGGGVAEILHRLVPMLNELGIPTTWEVMEGDAHFFGVTKTMHNALHGAPDALTDEDREFYHERNRACGRGSPSTATSS